MSKLQNIADRAPRIVAALEARAEKLDSRLTALEKNGNGAFDKWDGHLAEQESAIAVAEDAINKLSNGGPPLDDSGPASREGLPPVESPTALPGRPFREPGAGGGAS